jgi:hypothetical protein
LHNCETWYLIFKEEHIYMVFENEVMRKLYLDVEGWSKLGMKDIK